MESNQFVNQTLPTNEAFVVHVIAPMECVSNVYNEDDDNYHIVLRSPREENETEYNYIVFDAVGDVAAKFVEGQSFSMDAAVS